ncbi:HNH endonuclease [Arthrobacter phage RadFad]|nr:HNH endonuclease [Arthrobacter phage RadFad]
MPKPTSDPLTRFWPKVNKTATCWLWTAYKNPAGYGTFGAGSRASGVVLAHRFAWELENGPVPDGMDLDHTCHTPACVRPSHLRPVNNKQNHENFKGAFSTSGTGVRGVSWDKRRGLYRATVTHNYKQHMVGRFETIEEASAAVQAKRLELFTHNTLDRL